MTTAIPIVRRARVAAVLESFRQVRIAIVGDVMLDRYLLGDVERISPEAPVPILILENERDVAGGAANVAANILALGATPRLVGAVGNDVTGEGLRQTLTGLGIAGDGLITVPGRPTTSKTRILARGQQIVRIDREVTNPLPDQYRDALLAATHRALAESDVLVLSDYDKGVLDGALIRELIQVATKRKLPVVVDPKPRQLLACHGATLLTPNRRELEAATGTHFTEEDADFEATRERLGVAHLLVTLGAEGMALASAGQPIQRAPSIAREVFDVSGAGDTVTAWMAAALGMGMAIGEAAWLANLAASVEVGKLGTATVSQAELLDAWDQNEEVVLR